MFHPRRGDGHMAHVVNPHQLLMHAEHRLGDAAPVALPGVVDQAMHMAADL